MHTYTIVCSGINLNGTGDVFAYAQNTSLLPQARIMMRAIHTEVVCLRCPS